MSETESALPKTMYVGSLLVPLTYELVTLEFSRCGVCHLVLSGLHTVHLSGANFNNKFQQDEMIDITAPLSLKYR